jgi:acetate kinase
MNVLALNCGSSSAKYQLFDSTTRTLIASGIVERIGAANAVLKHTDQTKSGAVADVKESECRDHDEAIRWVLEAVFASLPKNQKIDAVGHRVVHGGDRFARSVVVTDDVVKTIEALTPLAPLHNPGNLAGIRAVTRLLPGLPQVAVFDTAFHQAMPPEASIYAVPRKWVEELGVRRYGFHGTSHLYVSRKIAQLLGVPVGDLRIITCHIGNGASISAVKGGHSIDTSMGLTPLEGVTMGTRSGSIDPGIIPYVATQTSSRFEDVFEALIKKSGMLGLTGHSDLRDVEAGAAKGDQACVEALKIYGYSIKKYIGAYAAVMGGVDVVVFTAGVGENSATIRRLALENLDFLGLRVDEEANKNLKGGREGLISTRDSKVKVAVLHTNEELMIVEDTVALLHGKSPADPSFRYSFESDAPAWKAERS